MKKNLKILKTLFQIKKQNKKQSQPVFLVLLLIKYYASFFLAMKDTNLSYLITCGLLKARPIK